MIRIIRLHNYSKGYTLRLIIEGGAVASLAPPIPTPLTSIRDCTVSCDIVLHTHYNNNQLSACDNIESGSSSPGIASMIPTTLMNFSELVEHNKKQTKLSQDLA